MTTSLQSSQHIVNKIIVLATGMPGAADVREQLVSLFETNGDWTQVAVVIDDYMNTLLAQTGDGIPGLIRAMANNGFGAQLSLAEAQVLTNEFIANGIDSWSGLFAWLHENMAGDLAAVWNNRADGAENFTGLLGSLGKNDDYKGSQVLAAAREWIGGIGASEASTTAAKSSVAELIGRFVDGKVSGTAIDGYVAGATIFIDVNGNGQRDDNEPFTVSDGSGNFVFAEDVLPAGKLIGSGGTDLATGLPFEGEMSAPSGALVISPLTTLVQQMMTNEPGRSQADIEEAIFTALDIPRVDLSSFDPIKTGLDTAASRESQVNAAKIQAVTSQLVNVMSVSAALTEKLSPGNTKTASGSITALASVIRQAASEGRVVSLSNADTVTNVLKTAAQNAGVVNDQSSSAQQESLTRLSTQAGDTLKGVNGKTLQALDALSATTGGSVVDALSDMYKLQKLTQTQVSPSIRASGSDDLQTVVTRFNGNSLDSEVSNVQAGNLTAGTATTQGNVTRPVNTPEPVPPAAPTLALARDTGASDSDLITSAGVVNVDDLVAGGRWEYSLDGLTWIDGSGSSVAVEGDGAKTVSVRQTSTDELLSAEAQLSFTLDSSAPAQLSLSLQSDTGASASDNVSSNGLVNFDLTDVEEGAIWQYSLDGITWTTGSVNSLTVEGDGAKTVLIRQSDVAGNVSSVAALKLKLDTTTPVGLGVLLHEDSGAADSLTNNGQVDFDLSALEEGASWHYSFDGTTWSAGSDSSVTVEGDGAKTVSVRQTDLAGNASSVSTVNFTLDTSAAALGLSLAGDTGTSDTDAVTSNGLVNFDLTALEEGATWQYSTDGTTWSAGSVSSVTVEGDGAKTVSVRQTDVAGNVSNTSTVNFTLDISAAALGLSLAGDTGASDTDAVTSNGLVNFDLSALEEGATWQYSLDGKTWSAGSDNSVIVEGDGGKTVSVRQTDAAGNVSSVSTVNFTLDTSAAALGVSLAGDTGTSAGDSVTSNGLVNFDLTALEEGATWQYSLDGTTWNTGSESSVTVEGDGAKAVSIRQTDVAGNVSSVSTVNFTLDTSAAALGLSLARDTGTSDTDAVTSNGLVNFDLTALEEGATWQYSLDGKTWSAGSDNSVIVEGDGGKTVSVRQTDVAGNVSNTSTVNFTLDTSVAALGLSLAGDTGTSASDRVTSNGLVNFDLTALEEGASWQYSLDGTTWNTGSNSSVTVEGDGAKAVSVRQTDVAGNVSSASTVNFTLDTSAAALGLSLARDTGTSDTDAVTSNGLVNFDLSALEQGAIWQYSLDGTTWNTGSESSVTVEGDGAKAVSIRQTDVAGNVSSVSTVNFTLDTSAAALGLSLAGDTGTSDTDAVTSNGLVNFDLTALEEGASWQYSTDGTTWSAGSVSSVTVEGDGAKTVSVRQTDLAGNVSSVSTVNFTLDTSAAALGLSLAGDTGTSDTDTVTSNGLVNFDLSALEEGATWQYSLDGKTWSAGSDNSVIVEGDGGKTVSVRQTDVAGNVSSASTVNFTLDTSAAALGVSLTGDTGTSDTDAVTSNGLVSFDLTALEEGATWQYSTDGTAWTTGSQSSVTVEGDGAKTVSIRQTDVAGNVSNTSTVNFTLDTSAAALGLSLAGDTGTSDTDAVTSNGLVNFDLSALEEGAIWQYSLDGTTWNTGSESSVTVEGDGAKAVSIRQTDVAGNVSSVSTVNFTLDTSAAALGVSLATDSGSSGTDAVTSNGLVNFDLSALEEGAAWHYSLDGTTWNTGSESSITVEGDGAKTVSIRQTDIAGNVSSVSTLNFALDTTVPAVLGASLQGDTGTNASDNVTSNGQVNFNLNALEVGASWQYSLDGESWTTGSLSSVTVEGDGARTVSVRQTDQAGNVSTTSSVSFTLDTTAPASLGVALHQDSGATDSVTNNGQVDFDLSALEESATWQYSLDGTTWNTGSDSSVTVEGDGAKTVSIRQSDVAGNISNVESVSLSLDTSAAALGVSLAEDTGSSNSDALTSNGLVNFDLSALEQGATWQYSLDGKNWTVGSESSVTVEGNGANTVSVRQTDVAGNVSNTSTLNFTLDTTAPSAPTVALVSSVQLPDNDDKQAVYLTNDRTVQISGLEDGAGWQLRGGGYVGNWQDGSGSTLELAGDDGDKALQVRQVDAAGNIQTDWVQLNVTLDTTAPASLGVSLQDDTGSNASDAVTNYGVVDFDLSGLEDSAIWEYSLDGTTWTKGSGSIGVEGGGDGEKTVSVRQTDQAGNVGDVKSVSFTLDTTAPAALGVALHQDSGSSNSDALTNNGLVNIDLSALEQGATWQYSLDGTTWTTGSESSVTVEGEGANTVSIRQTDVAGNVSNTSTLNFTLDTTAPGSPTVALVSSVQLPDNDDKQAVYLTNDRTVQISGLEDGAGWQLRGGGYVGNWQDGSGSTLELAGDDGDKALQVRQVDAAGNIQSDWVQLNVTLDTTAPASLGASLHYDTGASDGVTSYGQVDFDLSALETSATWQYSLDGSTWTIGSGSSVDVEGSDDGLKTVSIRQTDQAGNVGDVKSVSFTLDTSAAALGVSLAEDTGSSNSDALTNNGLVNFDLSALEQGATWQYSLDGTTWTTGSESSVTVEGNGANTVSVRQTDVAGNVSSTSTLNFTLDTFAPAVLGVFLQEDTGASDNITSNRQVNFDTSALEASASWQYSLDGTNWTTGSEKRLDVHGDGAKTVSIRQTDQAGNISQVSSVSFTLDTVAPILTTTPTMASGTTISLQANEAVTAGLYNVNDNSLVGSTSTIAANTLGTITVAAQDSVMDTYIKITDGAGKSTTATVSGQFQSGDLAGIQTSAWIRVLLGTTGNDTITGRDHTMNLIFGFDGNDELRGGIELQGNRDYIHGGSGNDRLLNDNGYADTMFGGEGDDYIEIDNGVDEAFEYADEGVDEIGLYQDGSLNALGNNFENLSWLGFNAKTLTGDDGPNVIVGAGTNDTINGLGGTDTITGGGGSDIINGITTVDTPDGADTYIYLSKSDSSVNNTAITAFGFDVVTVTDGDIFDYALDITSVTPSQYYVGQVPKTNGDELLAQLNSLFLGVTGGFANGVHALSVSIGNNQRFLMVDVNSDRQITEDDLIIQTIEVTGISNHTTNLTLSNGNIIFGYQEPVYW